MPQHLNPDLILIDDDDLIHRVWTFVAQSKGHSLACFYQLDDFLKANFAKDVPVYVDYSLGGSETGIDIIQRLRILGFTNLYLSTGHSKESLSLADKTISVVSKDYPFENN